MRTSLRLLLSLLATFVASLSAQQPVNGPPVDSLTVLQVQIFLDQKLFGPGKLDGASGEFTYKAVVNYNFSRGRKDLYDWSPVLEAAAREVPVPLAAYRIGADLKTFVNPSLPEKPEEQAKQSYMAYRSYAELVAERFHTDETFLAKCNPNLNLATLKPGDLLTVPNVKAFRIEDVKAMQSFPKDTKLSTHTLVVDTVERMAVVYTADERLLAAFPITPGKPEFIPVGTWSVKNMMTTPNFRYDKQFLEEGVRGKEAYQIPPGPNSPVGIIWCGLSKSGIGLHGTALPRTIGRSQSAGCVRLANWDAIRLPTLIRPEATVIVR